MQHANLGIPTQHPRLYCQLMIICINMAAVTNTFSSQKISTSILVNPVRTTYKSFVVEPSRLRGPILVLCSPRTMHINLCLPRAHPGSLKVYRIHISASQPTLLRHLLSSCTIFHKHAASSWTCLAGGKLHRLPVQFLGSILAQAEQRLQSDCVD